MIKDHLVTRQIASEVSILFGSVQSIWTDDLSKGYVIKLVLIQLPHDKKEN